MILKSNWAVGWNAEEQLHNAAMVRNVVLGDAMASAMYGGNEETRRFAATVLDAIGFTKAANPTAARKGRIGIAAGAISSREIGHIHRVLEKQIYERNLAKPFMGDDELSEYLLRETLRANNREDLLRVDTKGQDVGSHI